MRLAILASRNGTNAQAVLEHVRDGRIDAVVAVVVTNRPDAGVIARAESFGVPVEIVPSKGIADREEYDRTVLSVLSRYGVDIVVLAGWMRILSPIFVHEYEGRMLNLHPALLPSFTGGTGIDDAFQYGVKLAGCSVHLVSQVLDGGPIVIQAAVPVGDDRDEFEARVHDMEHLILPQAVNWMVQDRIRVDGRTVRITPSPKPVAQTDIVDGCLVCPPLEL